MFFSQRFLKRFLKKLFILIRINYFKYISDITLKGKNYVFAPTLFLGLGDIHIDNSTIFGFVNGPKFWNSYIHIEAREISSKVEIGKNTILGNNLILIAEKKSIRIGENVKIGHNVQIYDSDFHSKNIEERLKGKQGKQFNVTIKNNCWIGCDCIILKGVTIGENSIIGAGNIIRKDIADNSIVI